MTQDERQELKMKLKRVKWTTKKQTGKNPTKKEMSGVFLQIAQTVVRQEPPRTNWKPVQREPESIDAILAVIKTRGVPYEKN